MSLIVPGSTGPLLPTSLRELLARGLIHRKRAKEDGRAYAIKLTSQGWKGLRDAEPGAVATNSRLLAVLPPPKRQEFLDILAMIVDATDGK